MPFAASGPGVPLDQVGRAPQAQSTIQPLQTRHDPASTATLAVYPLGAAGAATVQLPIPTDVGLAGLELELQGATLDPVGGGFALTSSVQLRIR